MNTGRVDEMSRTGNSGAKNGFSWHKIESCFVEALTLTFLEDPFGKGITKAHHFLAAHSDSFSAHIYTLQGSNECLYCENGPPVSV